jgi:hypothetical protein
MPNEMPVRGSVQFGDMSQRPARIVKEDVHPGLDGESCMVSSLPRSQVNDCHSWVGSLVTVLLRALAMVMAP